MNKISHWPVISIFVILLLFLAGYLFLDNQLLVKSVFILLGLVAVYLFVRYQQFYGILFLTIYLVAVCLYSYLATSALPIWLVIVVLLIVVGGLSYLLVNSVIPGQYPKLFYSLLVYLVSLEVFLVMIPWPINPQFKGLIYLTNLYLFWGLLSLKISHQLSGKKLVPYLITFLLLIIIIVNLSSWVLY